MFNTTRGILLNFKYLVDKLGYIPNSGRIYEASRSQPPFFTLMVWDYFQTTGAKDMEFLREIFPALRKELQFWVNNRSVTVRKGRATHQLFQYRPDMNCPRPEGYLADINDALKSNSSDFVYRSIAAACESGWDFSSRWFRDPKSAGLSKSLIATIDIIPVDLNAILCRAMTILRIFAEKLGEETATNELKDQRKKLLSAMNEVLFNSTNGVWFDYVLSTGQLRHEFYPSNLSPLWAECYEPTNDLHDRIEKYVIDNNLMTFAGGLPTSLFHSGQQWDFPNGWPPLVHLVIDGFSRTNHSGLSSLAFDLAEKWIAHNYWGFVVANGSMWEKYDVNSTSGLPGSGGEYTVQEGFGWTNGVVLDLLKTYSHRLFVKQKPNNSPQSEPHSSQLLFCLLVVPVGLGILLLFLYMLESHRHRRTMTVSGVNPNIPTVTGWISNLHSYY